MSKCILLKGGGGADLDVITAESGDILDGKVIVDKEGNPLTGSLTLTGSATASQVLNGATFYNTNAKTKETGTMPNNGAVAPSALGAGGSYTIPVGYHNGSGRVTVQSLATMTASGDARPGQILSGKKAYVDGTLLTGSMTNRGAQTKTITPSASAQSYTIPAGYHNGSGKITINAIPTSQYLALAGANFFKNGTFGNLYTALGIINKGPYEYSGGMYATNETTEEANYSKWVDGKSLSLNTIENGEWKINATLGSTGLGSPGTTSAWVTRKPIDLTNVSKIIFKVRMESGYNSGTTFFAVDPDTKKGVACGYEYAPIITETYTLDVSSLKSKCLFGMYRSDGNSSTSCHWYISEISFA